MSYSIGVGVLFDEDTNNHLRSLALAVGDAADNFCSLGQVPHIAIKRPFTVDGLEDVKRVASIMEDLAAETVSFECVLDAFGSFSDSTLFVAPSSQKEFSQLHNEILTRLRVLFIDAQVAFEGKDMVFHSTIGMKLSKSQFALATEASGRLASLPIHCKVTKLGLFLGLDENTHWAVVYEKKLRTA